MINLGSQYPTQTASDPTNYPYGKAQNITTPGDGTGTPLEAAFYNDLNGMMQAIVNEGGVTPSGSPETIVSSDIVDALKVIIGDLQGVTEYESAEQTIPAADTDLTVSHGLGAVPKFTYIALRCATAEHGYSIGDEIPITNDNEEIGDNAYGTWLNSLSIGFRRSNNIKVIDRSGGQYTNITNASWRLVFKAWK